MKKIALSFAVLGMVLAGSAFAKEKTTKTTTTTTTSASESPRAAASSSSSGLDFAVGLATYGGADAGGGIGGPALSGKFNLGHSGSVQVLASIATSNPFQFSVGGIYRHRVLGDGDPGFHIGGGATLGTAGGGLGGSSFFLNIFPVAGFHFSLGGALKRITLSFDGGMNFHITPGFQLQAGPISAVAGGAIHYQL